MLYLIFAQVRTSALLVARDLRSFTGRNVALVTELSGQDPLCASPARVRQALGEREMVAVPDTESWRCQYLERLLESRQLAHYNGWAEEESHLDTLIES